MRALRDFNLPKIVTDDVTIIMGLLGDLFPALNVPRKRDMEFEDYVKKAVVVRMNHTDSDAAQSLYTQVHSGKNSALKHETISSEIG